MEFEIKKVNSDVSRGLKGDLEGRIEGIEGRGTVGSEGQHANSPAGDKSPREEKRNRDLWSEGQPLPSVPGAATPSLSPQEQTQRNRDLWSK